MSSKVMCLLFLTGDGFYQATILGGFLWGELLAPSLFRGILLGFLGVAKQRNLGFLRERISGHSLRKPYLIMEGYYNDSCFFLTARTR